MNIYLCARDNDDELFNAWKEFCGMYDFVIVTCQPILDIKNTEAIVSPANSFGFMTGGIDLHYKNYYGQVMEDLLQEKIKKEFDGELLVGQAASVPIENGSDKKHLIAVPTMRLPQNVSYTINAYLAARAALRLALREGFNSVAFPGMGTGTGNMDKRECARQVSVAIDEVLLGNYKFPNDLYEELNNFKKKLGHVKWFESQTI